MEGAVFSKRRGLRLTPKDIKRFGRRLIAELETLWPGARFSLNPLSEEGDPKALSFPLLHRGRSLGSIRLSFPAGQAAPDIAKLLPPILKIALDNICLRKALSTDRDTGLCSREHFRLSLTRALSRAARAGAPPLSMNDEPNPELMLVMAELRQLEENEDPSEALAALADRFAGRLPGLRPARLSSRRLCFLLNGRPEESRLQLESVLDEQLAARPESRPVAAWAALHNLGPDDAVGSGTRAALRRRAAALAKMADTALFYARQFRGPALALAFDDITARHGQVLQLLPLDRMLINLGRSVGAASGQVYMVETPGREGGETRYKGEITILEASESYSVAALAAKGAGARIAPGDRLSFSRLKLEEEREGAVPAPGSGIDFLDKLAGRESFLAKVAQWPPKAPMQAALLRLDAFDKTLAVLGRGESERLLGFVFEKAAASFPGAALGRWQMEMLALAWEKGAAAEIKPTAHRLVSELSKTGPVSVGLVFDQPHLGRPGDLFKDALKALSEASFSGHGQVAVFGPLALNISGDQLFEGGDLSGAAAEYERGLALAPDNVNLLNSLGVCYGRLGRFHEAMEIFERIGGLEPGNMMAHYNTGYTLLLSGRMEEAEQALARAAELDPDNFDPLFHLGKTALELGHLDKALPALSKAAALKGARPAVFRLLGQALMLARENRPALAAFKKAVKADPNDAYSLSSLGTLFVELANDLEVARSLFQKSVEIDPTSSLYRQRLGRLLFNLGDFAGAEHHLNMAREYGSRAPELHYQLGCLAEEQGRADEAAEHFRAALSQDPAYKPALEKL